MVQYKYKVAGGCLALIATMGIAVPYGHYKRQLVIYWDFFFFSLIYSMHISYINNLYVWSVLQRLRGGGLIDSSKPLPANATKRGNYLNMYVTHYYMPLYSSICYYKIICVYFLFWWHVFVRGSRDAGPDPRGFKHLQESRTQVTGAKSK